MGIHRGFVKLKKSKTRIWFFLEILCFFVLFFVVVHISKKKPCHKGFFTFCNNMSHNVCIMYTKYPMMSHFSSRAAIMTGRYSFKTSMVGVSPSLIQLVYILLPVATNLSVCLLLTCYLWINRLRVQFKKSSAKKTFIYNLFFFKELDYPCKSA